MEREFTKDNFSAEVLEASKDKPVLVDFFATWCGPCQVQGPIVEDLAKDLGDKAVIGKLDSDQAMDIARSYGVMSIPTLIVFRNGEPAERFVGVQDKEILAEAISKHL